MRARQRYTVALARWRCAGDAITQSVAACYSVTMLTLMMLLPLSILLLSLIAAAAMPDMPPFERASYAMR